jgi:DNA-binding MurR/RpiR family transcriptional regulator
MIARAKGNSMRQNDQTHASDSFPGRLIGTKIVGVYARLQPAERRVAEYVLAHPHEVTGLPIATLAQRCGVSQNTVNRFCRSVGIEGYPELKIALAQHLVIAASQLSEQGEQAAGAEGIVREAFRFNISILENTLALNQTDMLQSVADLIARCRSVRWFGNGGSGIVCQDAALRLKQLGVDAEAVTDPYTQVVEACWLGKRDVAIGVSHTGESRAVVEALRLSRESGAATIGITNYAQSTLSQNAENVLLTASDKVPAGASTTAVASRIAQLALVDAICALVAIKRTRQVSTAIDRIDAYVDANLRIDERE